MKPNELPKLRWPNLSAVTRRYVVRDDHGRYGVASYDPVYHEGVLFAHPVELPDIAGAESVPGAETLPSGAIVMTNTPWRLREDGKYHGVWCDYDGHGQIPECDIRALEIVDDLGWVLPDWAAGQVAQPPEDGDPEDAVVGVRHAVEYCREVGHPVSERGLRKACARGYIPGARRVGRDWVMTYRSINHYLDNRPRRGPKKELP